MQALVDHVLRPCRVVEMERDHEVGLLVEHDHVPLDPRTRVVDAIRTPDRRDLDDVEAETSCDHACHSVSSASAAVHDARASWELRETCVHDVVSMPCARAADEHEVA